MAAISDYLAWFSNLVSFLVIINFIITTYTSPCFSAWDTGISIGTLILAVLAQSFTLFFKSLNIEVN